MLTREQVLEMALELPGAVADQPFPGDFDSTVLRHGDTRKWFALIIKAPMEKVGLTGEGQAEIINLKCDPLVSYGLRQVHPEIVPAWHMNRALWISVRLKGNLPVDVMQTLLRMSFDLTRVRTGRRPSIRKNDTSV